MPLVAKFRFLPEAEAELLHEITYYRSIRPELGEKFAAAVDEAVRKAADAPVHGAPRPANTRRRRVKGFPFSVVYRVEKRGILIAAIADDRRPPDYWAKRIA